MGNISSVLAIATAALQDFMFSELWKLEKSSIAIVGTYEARVVNCIFFGFGSL
jgi:hypothetical protein